MAGKKKASTTADVELQTLKIGSRVRCTDDRVEGRIVWANGVWVKITWNDGEKVTWRRDSLADRPIEIIVGDEDQATAPTTPPEHPELPQAEQETDPQAPKATATEPNALPPEPEAVTEESTAAAEPTEASAEPEVATQAQPPVPDPAEAPLTAASEPTPMDVKLKRARNVPMEAQEKKLSAIDAAVKVLAETHTPMNCQELIGAMAAKGYWTSPGGKTPAATLYSAISREVTTKGDHSRFTKTERGKFALAVRG
jgi:HB1, ASXL, restriction endonuclease HTH domain